MKNCKKLLIVAGLAFICANVNAQSKQANTLLDEAKKAIAESNAIYFTSYVKNDSSIFLNRYASDACLMGANAHMMCGRKGIAQFFRSSYNNGLRNGRFFTTAVYGDGNGYVTEEGIGEVFDAKGKLISRGKYLVLWKKTSNGWKMFRDSFSGDEKPAVK